MKIHFLDDDYPTNRYHELTLEEVANELSMAISYYSNPEDLLQIYSNSEIIPDVLFLDVNMPRMKCWEFLDDFSDLEPDSKLTVILLTTSEDPLVTNRAKDYELIKAIKIKPLEPGYLKVLSTLIE